MVKKFITGERQNGINDKKKCKKGVKTRGKYRLYRSIYFYLDACLSVSIFYLSISI